MLADNLDEVLHLDRDRTLESWVQMRLVMLWSELDWVLASDIVVYPSRRDDSGLMRAMRVPRQPGTELHLSRLAHRVLRGVRAELGRCGKSVTVGDVREAKKVTLATIMCSEQRPKREA